MNLESASLSLFQMNISTPCHNESSFCIGKHVFASYFMCCSGKFSKTSDMGMYGTSKLYLLMMSQALQQRLQVSHNFPGPLTATNTATFPQELLLLRTDSASLWSKLSLAWFLQRATFTSAFKPWCLMSHN